MLTSRSLAAAVLILSAGIASAAAPRDKDLQLIKSRLTEAALASPGRAGQGYANSQRPDGSWADIDYKDQTPGNWKPAAHLSRLVAMAQAYRASASPELKAKILLGFEYWVKLDPRCPNWWHNEIGAPQYVGSLLLLMEGQFPGELVDAGVAIMKRSKWARWTGQNLVWGATIQIVRGCVQNDPEVIAEAYGRMYQEIRIAKLGEEGVQADFSFHQHGPLLYAGGYGAGFTADCSRFIYSARGTRFAPPADKLRILESYILDGQQWMTHGQLFDYSVTGREITRPGKSAASLAPVVARLAEVGQRKEELSIFPAQLAGQNYYPLIGNRHFWRSDYMAHQRGGRLTSIRMFSDRILCTDGFINGENKKSHRLADGATLVYTNGEEYRDIFPVWDWLRIPGTTCEQNVTLVPRQVNRKGATSFVGGVSDGANGVAAMHSKTGALEARAAWFCFEDLIVCLGAGINCPTDNPTFTSINQCWLRGPVKVSGADGDLPRGEREMKLAWAWHDSVGYVFPGESAVHVANRPQTGAWSDIGIGPSAPITRDVFSLWIDHGRQARDRSYQYILMPGADEKSTAQAARDLPVRILSNTARLQAVWSPKLQLLGIVFTQAGGITGPIAVTVDQPCLVLVQQKGQTIRIAVSNPEGKALTVNAQVGANGKAVRFDLPGGLDGGRSVTREIEAR